jgi:biopolymer transport protein ExbD
MTVAQVIVGLREGLWEPTDEVMGPGDRNWVAIEAHPQFQAVAAEIEPPARKEHGDETRLDMNALIDVCLVLLIFFILTAKIIEKKNYLPLDMAQSVQKVNPNATRKVTSAQVKENMISVRVYLENGSPQVKVENRVPVGIDEVQKVLEDEVRDTKKHEMLLNISGVTWGVAVKVHDAAKAVGINQINYLTGRS